MTGNQGLFFGKETRSHQAVPGNAPFFQAKLHVGEPDDKYEQEADALTDQVVQHKSMDPVVQQKQISSIIQKQEAATPAFPTPHEAASNAVLNLVNMFRTEHILFDGWNNDCRDNNKNGRSDGADTRESSSTDGSHIGRTYAGFDVEANQRCFGGEGGYVELRSPFTTMQEVKYRVCADVISKAYQDAGVPIRLTRRVHDLVHFFQTSRQCDFWEFSTFPGPFLMGDFICSYSERERHGHAGMVIRNCARGEVPYVIHLPGPSQGIARRRYDPRRTNDLTVEPWPISIRAIYGIGRYHG